MRVQDVRRHAASKVSSAVRVRTEGEGANKLFSLVDVARLVSGKTDAKFGEMYFGIRGNQSFSHGEKLGIPDAECGHLISRMTLLDCGTLWLAPSGFTRASNSSSDARHLTHRV